MTTNTSILKSEKKRIALLLAAGLALRLAYGWAARGVPPWNDMAVYDASRLALLSRMPYASDWPPLYPLLLSAVSMVFGKGYAVLYAAQAFLSTLTCLLIYLITKETFGRAAAFIALAAAAVYVDTIWYSAVLMAETTGLLFLTLTVYLMLKRKHPALSGAAFGLACLTKGLYLIALPALCAWNIIRLGFKEGTLHSLKLAAVSLLLILPWTIYNSRRYHSFVLLEPHTGVAMMMGHNPAATGGCDYYFVGQDYAKFLYDPALTTLQRDAQAKQFAINYMLHNPGRELQLFALKFSKFWSFRTHFDFNDGPYPLRRYFFLASIIMHMLIFPAFVLGAVFSLDNKDALVSVLMITAYTLVFTVIFSAFGRMRFSLVPFMLILAARGAVLLPELAARVRSGGVDGIKGKLALVLSLSAALYANFVYQVLSKYSNIATRFN